MKLLTPVFFLLLNLLPSPLLAQDRSYGRSMVINDGGIVATSHTLASQAGAQILARGGSAMDAAIAANAVLGVTEPMMNGIGGDLFLLYWDAKTGKLYGLNASGWAPRGLSIEYLKQKGILQMPQAGIDSVTVPGAVEGWAKAHARFGKLPWKDLFTPAIYYAEHGYPVPELIHDFWEDAAQALKQTPEAERSFLPGGKVPELGEMFSNPDLGKTLRLIAEGGRDAFYRGEIAQSIVRTSTELGGTMQADDLADFSAEWVEPISINYRGWKVYELPPNGQGMAALEMLNIMSTLQPDKAGPLAPMELHNRIEAMKLAYSDLYRYNADPRFAKVPVKGLLADDYAKQRAALIDPDEGELHSGQRLSGEKRHDLSGGGRPGRQYRLAHTEQLRRLRFRSRGEGPGIHFAGSRRTVRARSQPSQCAGAAQAAVSHHHSRVHGAGRHAHWIRHHGRSQPAAGARPVCLQLCGLRNEHSGRALRAALHRPSDGAGNWLRHRDRIASPGGDADRTGAKRAQVQSEERVFDRHGPRAGRAAQFENAT